MILGKGLMAVILTCFSVSSVRLPARPYFNDQEVPESLEDLVNIQKALKNNLERARLATVCLEIDGGGSGSGVIVSEDGLILTAAHVTAGVDREMTVIMEDGKKYHGVSLGLQSSSDAAMFQITDSGPFPFIDIDQDDSYRLGDWAFSLGHSGGFDEERGINVRIGRVTFQADTTIQSGCMLIGGDSGGPLFDLNGNLIGIHSRVGQSKEESMHVPIREFQRHWDQMLDWEFIEGGNFAQKGEDGSGFLGVVAEVSSDAALKISQVYQKSAATDAGLKQGDVITSMEVKRLNISLKKDELTTPQDFYDVLEQLGSGDSLRLEWMSGGEAHQKTILLGERP